MGQRLIYPYTKAMTICGYKTAQYAKPKSQGGHGYQHYGIDISSIQGVKQADNIVRASGDGVVVWCVKDNPPNKAVATSLGWALAIRYDNCISHGGTVKNLIVRYMHAATCYVKLGQTVKLGDRLLLEGSEGTGGPHVHFEIDTDTRWPQYTPQVSDGHSGWYKGTDSTLNPSYWLWQDAGHQQIRYGVAFSDRSWINAEDDDLPFVPTDELAELRRRIAVLETDKANLQATLEKMRKLIQQLAVL